MNELYELHNTAPPSDIAQLANVLGWTRFDLKAEGLEASGIKRCRCGRWHTRVYFYCRECAEAMQARFELRRDFERTILNRMEKGVKWVTVANWKRRQF